jgi:transcription-repair coupling factor (superfamily II helicase)
LCFTAKLSIYDLGICLNHYSTRRSTRRARDRFGELPEMVENLFYQMRVKLRAEKAGLAGVNWESGQIVLRYPTFAEDKDGKRLPDLGPGIRGGKNAYWGSFGENWRPKLLETLAML